MSDRTPQSQDKYIVRMPEGMRERLKEEASKSGRSLNAEIIARLNDSFEEAERLRGQISVLGKALTVSKLTEENWRRLYEARENINGEYEVILAGFAAAIRSDPNTSSELKEFADKILEIGKRKGDRDGQLESVTRKAEKEIEKIISDADIQIRINSKNDPDS